MCEHSVITYFITLRSIPDNAIHSSMSLWQMISQKIRSDVTPNIERTQREHN